MKVKNTYTYPAVISFDTDGIGIEFPDIPGCFSCVELDCPDIPHQIMHNAQEALSLHLYNMEEDGDPIPEPSDICSVKHGDREAVVWVDVNMPLFRVKMSNRNINKMCTVPAWLVQEADEAGINYSRTLQDALMDKLGIKHTPSRRRKK